MRRAMRQNNGARHARATSGCDQTFGSVGSTNSSSSCLRPRDGPHQRAVCRRPVFKCYPTASTVDLCRRCRRRGQMENYATERVKNWYGKSSKLDTPIGSNATKIVDAWRAQSTESRKRRNIYMKISHHKSEKKAEGGNVLIRTRLNDGRLCLPTGK